MADIIVIGIVLIVLCVAISYIVKAKKSGAKCIGCPEGCSCSSKENEETKCSCGCGSNF